VRFALKGRFTRRDALGAAKVALVATLLIAFCYVAVVVLLDYFVADHLTGQVDRQLASRLTAAVTDPGPAFSSSGVQTNGARYGLGIYGEPIALWAFDPSGVLTRSALGDPVLPAAIKPPAAGEPSAYNAAVAGTTYRLEWLMAKGRWLLAGESLTELGHVEAVLIGSEAIALPFLLAAFFLVALVIGLRSARPIETARQRQLEFTADASHELRTPLSVIEAEVSLARARPRSAADYEAALDRVATESRRLRAIVDDLLWLARRDSEPEPPARNLQDLAGVASRCAERFGAIASSRHQLLDLALPGNGRAPLGVLAPDDWLDMLVGTLIDNACRYTPAGGRIRLSAAATEADRVVLRVEDSGPGIAEADRPQVVRRFRRASAVAGGHGLGLAIAQSVAESTGGVLAFGTSELGGALVEVSWEPAVPEPDHR
jgi:signal transduction histidine kinase